MKTSKNFLIIGLTIIGIELLVLFIYNNQYAKNIVVNMWNCFVTNDPVKKWINRYPEQKMKHTKIELTEWNTYFSKDKPELFYAIMEKKEIKLTDRDVLRQIKIQTGSLFIEAHEYNPYRKNPTLSCKKNITKYLLFWYNMRDKTQKCISENCWNSLYINFNLWESENNIKSFDISEDNKIIPINDNEYSHIALLFRLNNNTSFEYSDVYN